MPIHIRAKPGEVAAVALLVGDPGRATRIAGELEDARCYNDNRGLLGYTGTYRGAPVSAQTTGMGAPSAAIVTEELADLGVRAVIRVGTCGAVGANVGVLDLVVATGAVPLDGTTRQYTGGAPFAPVPDFDVTRALVDAAAASGCPYHAGLYVTEDAFYRQPDDWRAWQARGVLAAEMEAAAIFTVALQRGLRAGAVCLAVDHVGERQSWASDDDIARGTGNLLRVALEAAVAIASGPVVPRG